MLPPFEKIQNAAEAVRKRTDTVPEFALILGTGMGGLSEEMICEAAIPFEEIPGFLPSRAPREGALLIGTLEQRSFAAMDARFHFYEGHSLEEITFPVRLLQSLGAERLIISNASGGLNPLFGPGDLVLVEDHINLMGVNPLQGPNDERLGTRFPDMTESYSKALIRVAEEVAQREDIKVQRGIYAAVTGPNVETRAELNFMRMIGADIVGVSTVPEVLAGVHCGLEILAISCITDLCLPESFEPVDVEEIIRIANETAPKLTTLIKGVMQGGK